MRRVQNRFACDRGRIAAAQIARDSRPPGCGYCRGTGGEHTALRDRRPRRHRLASSDGWNLRVLQDKRGKSFYKPGFTGYSADGGYGRYNGGTEDFNYNIPTEF